MSFIMDYLRNPLRIMSRGFVMIHPQLGKLSERSNRGGVRGGK